MIDLKIVMVKIGLVSYLVYMW